MLISPYIPLQVFSWYILITYVLCLTQAILGGTVQVPTLNGDVIFSVKVKQVFVSLFTTVLFLVLQFLAAHFLILSLKHCST